jgi:hypothetical protein
MPRSNEDERRHVQVLPERIGAVRLDPSREIVYSNELLLILRSLGLSFQVITPEKTTHGI